MIDQETELHGTIDHLKDMLLRFSETFHCGHVKPRPKKCVVCEVDLYFQGHLND